jgi:hypothetical protein
MYYQRGRESAWARRWERARQAHLLRVLEVLEESVLVPCNALADVGGGVREALDLTGLTAKEAG